jgi:mono/diheme cytochrome c family protein
MTTVIALVVYSCQSAEQMLQATYYTNGRDIYIKHCQNCHGAKGEGLSKLAPPLTDTVFLKNNRQKLAGYIKNGLNDTLTIHGQTYQEKMPGINLANIDIAQLIVYVTNSFGNKQGMYTQEQVAADLALSHP